MSAISTKRSRSWSAAIQCYAKSQQPLCGSRQCFSSNSFASFLQQRQRSQGQQEHEPKHRYIGGRFSAASQDYIIPHPFMIISPKYHHTSWFSTSTLITDVVTNQATTIAPPKRGGGGGGGGGNEEKGAEKKMNHQDLSRRKNQKQSKKSNHKRMKKHYSNKKKQRKKKVIQLLPLREELQSKDSVEKAFDEAAKQTELFRTKFKWIQSLENQLTKTQIQLEDRKKPAEEQVSPLLRKTQSIIDDKKKIPRRLMQTSFWDILLVDNKRNNKTRGAKATKLPSSYDHDVEIIQTARDLAINEFPFFWSYSRLRKYRKEYKDDYMIKRIHMLQEYHNSKSLEESNQECHDLVRFLFQNLPSKSYQRLVSFFGEYIKICKDQKQQKQQQASSQKVDGDETTKREFPSSSAAALVFDGIVKEEEGGDIDDVDDEDASEPHQTSIGNIGDDDDDDDADVDEDDVDFYNEKKSKKSGKIAYGFFCTGICSHARSHVHIVLPELADFFYVNKIETRNDADDNIDGDDILTTDASMVTSDWKVRKASNFWKEARDKYVESFLSVQSILIEEYKKEKEGEQVKDDDDGDGSSIDEISASSSSLESDIDETDLEDEDEDDEDEDEELEIMATFEEATSIPTEAKSPASKKLRRAMKPRHYVVFDALSIDASATNITHLEAPTTGTPLADFPSAAPVDRLVMIDNLPIDITENRLLEAYSRCGDIEAIKVFQQRLDLDPGLRALDKNKKIRKPSSSFYKWRRPRTPLYAMILFRDANGASNALIDPLRIFGMVIDQHLIRSYRTSDMTELYLEDIRMCGGSVTQVECELSKILYPGLYVCLDVGRRQRGANTSINYKMKFPNFEMTYWAYLKLSSQLDFLNDDDEGEAALHWMETPMDANLYWTRELNF